MPLAGKVLSIPVIPFIFFLVFVSPSIASDQSPGETKVEVKVEAKEIPNPHWKEGMCGECHEGTPEKGKPLTFRYGGDFITLCNRCHGLISSHEYIHATGMVPSEEKLRHMPEDFKEALHKDREGRLTCIVCHNLVYQCLKEEFWREKANPLFLRDGPYAYRATICYKCHEAKKYARLNPHDQINDEGEILTSRCSVCHIGTPDVKKVRSIKEVRFKVEKDLSRLCRSCHNDIPRHPGVFIGLVIPGKKLEPSFTHLRVPPEKVLKRLEKMTAEKGIIMPLEPGTGKIFCSTCHNPHERGIQRLTRADRGADNEQRLRTMRKSDLCLMCHAK